MKIMGILLSVLLVFGYAATVDAKVILQPATIEEVSEPDSEVPATIVTIDPALLTCDPDRKFTGEKMVVSTKVKLTTREEGIANIEKSMRRAGIPEQEIARVVSPEVLYRVVPILNPALGEISELKNRLKNYLQNLPTETKVLLAENKEILKQTVMQFYVEELDLVMEVDAEDPPDDDDDWPIDPPDFIYCNACAPSSTMGHCVLGGCVNVDPPDIKFDLLEMTIEIGDDWEVSWTFWF